MNKSQEINELAAALLKFHSMEISIKKDAVNPYFNSRYASLSGIIRVIKKPLAETGLSIIQLPLEGHRLETILLHSSGQYISDIYDMKPTKEDPQQQGSAITYQRRYALGAILNLDIDDDDDANQASEEQKPVKAATKRPINVGQFKTFCDLLRKEVEPEKIENLLKKARNAFSFNEQQENIINQITDGKRN